MNKKLKIVPFQIEHVDKIDIRKHELENIFGVKGCREKLEVVANSNASITVYYNDTILCIIGIYEMFKGVCEIWIIPSKSISHHRFLFARLTKNLFNQLWELNYYNRIQVTALNDDLHNRFFSWLGFELETPKGMKNFTINKCNYNMWSRTK